MPRKPLAIPELRSTPEQRAAQLAWARRYYQQHIAPIDKLWGECERRAKERMMETINAEVVERREPEVPPMRDFYVGVYPAGDGWVATGVSHYRDVVDTWVKDRQNSYIFHLAPPSPQPTPERPLAERVAELETIVQSILRREAEDIVAQHEQTASAPSALGVLDRLREQVSAVLTCDDDVSLKTLKSVLFLIDAARREAGK